MKNFQGRGIIVTFSTTDANSSLDTNINFMMEKCQDSF